MFFCSGVLIPFNIFAFTHGVRLISGKSTEKTGFKMKWLLLNPGVISVLIGLPLFLLNVTLPRILGEPVSYIASLNTPLAMLMFGTYLWLALYAVACLITLLIYLQGTGAVGALLTFYGWFVVIPLVLGLAVTYYLFRRDYVPPKPDDEPAWKKSIQRR